MEGLECSGVGPRRTEGDPLPAGKSAAGLGGDRAQRV